MSTPRDHRDGYDPPEREPVDLSYDDYLNAAFNNGVAMLPIGCDEACDAGDCDCT